MLKVFKMISFLLLYAIAIIRYKTRQNELKLRVHFKLIQAEYAALFFSTFIVRCS